jgi:hypothetical protein
MITAWIITSIVLFLLSMWADLTDDTRSDAWEIFGAFVLACLLPPVLLVGLLTAGLVLGVFFSVVVIFLVVEFLKKL